MKYREKMMSRRRRWEAAGIIFVGLLAAAVAVVFWHRGGSVGGTLLQGGGAKVHVVSHSPFAVGIATFGLLLVVGGILRIRQKRTSNKEPEATR